MYRRTAADTADTCDLLLSGSSSPRTVLTKSAAAEPHRRHQAAAATHAHLHGQERGVRGAAVAVPLDLAGRWVPEEEARHKHVVAQVHHAHAQQLPVLAARLPHLHGRRVVFGGGSGFCQRMHACTFVAVAHFSHT